MSLTLRKFFLVVMLVTGAALALAPTSAQACARYSCDRHYGYGCYHGSRHYGGCCACGPSYYRHGYGYHGYGHGRGYCRTYVSWGWFGPPRHYRRGCYSSCCY